MAPYLFGAGGALADSLAMSEVEIRRRVGWSLREEFSRHRDDASLAAAQYVFEPAHTAIQIALTEAWRERGIEPGATAGRSAGEFAAGYASGALTLAEAIELACRAGRLSTGPCGRGRVLFVAGAAENLDALRASAPAAFDVVGDVSAEASLIACVPDALESVVAFLKSHGLWCRVEPISFAAHSPLLDACASAFLEPVASPIAGSRARVPRYSAITGAAIDPGPLPESHWWDVLRQRMELRRLFDRLLADGYRVFLEIGGRASYETIVAESARRLQQDAICLPTMRWTEPLGVVMDETQAALRGLTGSGRRAEPGIPADR
jgi:acyl transferase domain-containing protein